MMPSQENFNLELLFKTEEGKTKKVTIKEPKEDVSAEVAQAALAAIVDADIFANEDGFDPYATATGARYVRRTVTDIYQVEA
ncbi:DUF2922 domain-containing protein [Aerococcus mictus]|nr:DUF2922 domain-containing protein [Aerococcus mictus]